MSIIYTFNTNMGCTSFKEQSKQVNASQEADGVFYSGVLEGGFIIFQWNKRWDGNWNRKSFPVRTYFLYWIRRMNEQKLPLSDDFFNKHILTAKGTKAPGLMAII